MASNRVSVEFPDELFGVEANIPLMHQVVIAQQAAARQGTHKTKRRAEVSGSGRKPFRQKGTGRARQGSTRAPHMVGGGVVHGPVPRDYSQRTPKKMKAAALWCALSNRKSCEALHVVEGFLDDNQSTPSTKTAREILFDLGLGYEEGKKILVVLDREDELTLLSLRNLPRVHLIFPDQLNTYDVLYADQVVFTQSAYESFVHGHTARSEQEADQ